MKNVKKAIEKIRKTRRHPYVGKEVWKYFYPRFVAGFVKDVVPINIKVGDIASFGNTKTGTFDLEVTAITDDATTPTISFKNKYTGSHTITNLPITKKWRYHNLVDSAPGTSTYANAINSSAFDECHIVVFVLYRHSSTGSWALSIESPVSVSSMSCTENGTILCTPRLIVGKPPRRKSDPVLSTHCPAPTRGPGLSVSED